MCVSVAMCVRECVSFCVCGCFCLCLYVSMCVCEFVNLYVCVCMGYHIGVNRIWSVHICPQKVYLNTCLQWESYFEVCNFNFAPGVSWPPWRQTWRHLEGDLSRLSEILILLYILLYNCAMNRRYWDIWCFTFLVACQRIYSVNFLRYRGHLMNLTVKFPFKLLISIISVSFLPNNRS